MQETIFEENVSNIYTYTSTYLYFLPKYDCVRLQRYSVLYMVTLNSKFPIQELHFNSCHLQSANICTSIPRL